MTGLLLLDVQHVGKLSRVDLGTGADVDRDGRLEAWEREASLVQDYALAASAAVTWSAVRTRGCGWGDYGDRHRRAAELAGDVGGRRAAYLACHLNSPGVDYALLVHDPRSAGGKELAEWLRHSFAAHCPELRRVDVRAAVDDGDWLERCWNTIRGIWAGPANLSGVCLEPCGVDHPLARDPDRIARAIGSGVVSWLTR